MKQVFQSDYKLSVISVDFYKNNLVSYRVKGTHPQKRSSRIVAYDFMEGYGKLQLDFLKLFLPSYYHLDQQSM